MYGVIELLSVDLITRPEPSHHYVAGLVEQIRYPDSLAAEYPYLLFMSSLDSRPFPRQFNLCIDTPVRWKEGEGYDICCASRGELNGFKHTVLCIVRTEACSHVD